MGNKKKIRLSVYLNIVFKFETDVFKEGAILSVIDLPKFWA